MRTMVFTWSCFHAAVSALARRLGVFDATTIGLGSMLGAGVFVAFAPAAAAAGSGVLVSLVLAGLVAHCNPRSPARLGAVFPAARGADLFPRGGVGGGG